MSVTETTRTRVCVFQSVMLLFCVPPDCHCEPAE